MSRPYFSKPFPAGFFDNAKLKKAHIFTFDVLCRHLDADPDEWIRTDSKTLARLLKQTSGIVSHTPKKILSMLKEWGYIDMPEDRPSRTWEERINHNSFLQVKILPQAWEIKEIVRAHSLEKRYEYMRIRYERRKAIQEQVQALLDQED